MKIIQCWDDGVLNDIRLTELLRKYKAKASFNINPGINQMHERSRGWLYKDVFAVYRLTLDEMKEVYKDFQIAGHSMTHPDLTKLDEASLKAQLDDCKAFLKDRFKVERCGMAYPGGNYDERVKKAVKDAGYLYSRTTKNISGPLPLNDPMELHSHCHFMASEFWDKYEEVRRQDGIFYFWGHSYEMMDDEALWGEFESKIARITDDPKVGWSDIVDLF